MFLAAVLTAHVGLAAEKPSDAQAASLEPCTYETAHTAAPAVTESHAQAPAFHGWQSRARWR